MRMRTCFPRYFSIGWIPWKQLYLLERFICALNYFLRPSELFERSNCFGFYLLGANWKPSIWVTPLSPHPSPPSCFLPFPFPFPFPFSFHILLSSMEAY